MKKVIFILFLFIAVSLMGQSAIAPHGSSLWFDGDNDCVNCGIATSDLQMGTQNFSICYWKHNSFPNKLFIPFILRINSNSCIP